MYAFELYLKSAKLGYAASQYKLGLAYEYGHLGLNVDPPRSIAWYTKAAEQGDPDAELALSGWYLTGFEPILPRNEQEAYLWARKAAEKGLAKAEYAVGYFMEYGVGVTVELEEARRWYVRAASQGNVRAIARLKGAQSQETKPSNWRSDADARNGNCIVM
jgi:TPR repeat protein